MTPQLDAFEFDENLNRTTLVEMQEEQRKTYRKIFAEIKTMHDDIEWTQSRLKDLMEDFDKLHPPEYHIAL